MIRNKESIRQDRRGNVTEKQEKTRRHLVVAAGDRNLSAAILGGKGHSIAEMIRMDIPVPPGFTITTTGARAFREHEQLPERLARQLVREMHGVEKQTGKTFGDSHDPLLVSVRSGAEVSMPGMMDTILNLGLNPKTVEGLAEQTHAPRFAYDCYRRFLTMFGNIVLKIDRDTFGRLLETEKEKLGITSDAEMSEKALRDLCAAYRKTIENAIGRPVPDDPWEQLSMATVAIFQSWDNERARIYRQAHVIPDYKGTAVTVQAMAFGNRGDDSGTGVVFSSNVSTGEKGIYGEFLPNAQGEDVVAGIRTPQPVQQMGHWNKKVYKQLQDVVTELSDYYGDVVDVEFTVEQGKLYVLQSRVAKRTAEATAAFVFQNVRNIKDPQKRANAILKKMTKEQVLAISRTSFDEEALAEAEKNRIATGLPVSPGAVTGMVALTSEQAKILADQGEKVILVRHDTSPDDLPGIMAASAIVTETGGMTCHAAVVACSMNKPAVTGATSIPVHEKEIISVDAYTGKIYRGEIKQAGAIRSKAATLLAKWIEQAKTHNVEEAEPTLNFNLLEVHESVNRLCNDFYLSQAMANATKGTKLQEEAASLKNHVHQRAAEIIATYLLLAVAAELRHKEHVYYYEPESKHAFAELWSKYPMSNEEDRFRLQERIAENLQTRPLADHVRFLELAETCFKRGDWGEAFGGYAWGQIAETAKKYLTHELGKTEFVDHAFDLQHNGGTVFGKRDQMLGGNRETIYNQLEEKKHARDLASLWQNLKVYCADLSPEVASLLNKGNQQGSWKV